MSETISVYHSEERDLDIYVLKDGDQWRCLLFGCDLVFATYNCDPHDELTAHGWEHVEENVDE